MTELQRERVGEIEIKIKEIDDLQDNLMSTVPDDADPEEFYKLMEGLDKKREGLNDELDALNAGDNHE
jgi:hypothetical protein